MNKIYKNNVKAIKKYYDNATKEQVIEDMFLDICDLQTKIDRGIEYNKQIIEDTKSFYRPTADRIYSGDCLMDIAEQNIRMLEGKE